MKRFILGMIVGAVVWHFAEERKKKMAIDDLKEAGNAAAEAGASVADAVKSAGSNMAASAQQEEGPAS